MNALRAGLPPLPPKMAALPIDARGYPVPFFVAEVDGVPDHRVADARKLELCLREDRCWICGGFLGRFRAFCIGPMCAITRASSEPPQHLECAQYAAQACPFLTRPRAQRRDAHLPEEVREPGGIMLRRNPGAVGIWVTLSAEPQPAPGGRGLIFRIGEPVQVYWYAEGRPATRAEVEASLDSGLPALAAYAEQEGEDAVRELHERAAAVRRTLEALPSEATP